MKNFLKKLSPHRKKILYVVIAVVIAIFLAKGKISGNMDEAARARMETDRLIAQISKIMVLPSDEIPTLATVSDVSRLTGQPFFKNAKNGDKVLFYSYAQKAILYDPKARKILEVGSVVPSQPEAAQTATSSAQTAVHEFRAQE